MISLMYKLAPGQIEGAPEWVKSVLAERFGLK